MTFMVFGIPHIISFLSLSSFYYYYYYYHYYTIYHNNNQNLHNDHNYRFLFILLLHYNYLIYLSNISIILSQQLLSQTLFQFLEQIVFIPLDVLEFCFGCKY